MQRRQFQVFRQRSSFAGGIQCTFAQSMSTRAKHTGRRWKGSAIARGTRGMTFGPCRCGPPFKLKVADNSVHGVLILFPPHRGLDRCLVCWLLWSWAFPFRRRSRCGDGTLLRRFLGRLGKVFSLQASSCGYLEAVVPRPPRGDKPFDHIL